MRKLLAIGLCLLFGCSESPVDENGRHIAEKSGNSFVVKTGTGGGEWFFTYAVVDGHEYLVMGGTHKSGLTHSPKCPCLNKNQTNNIPHIKSM